LEELSLLYCLADWLTQLEAVELIHGRMVELVDLPAGRQARSVMFYCYVIKSIISNRYYKGLTCNLELRISQHNAGRVRSTRNYAPFKLVFVELAKDRISARQIEKFLKSGFGREFIREIDQA
jgi:putative endonuclease